MKLLMKHQAFSILPAFFFGAILFYLQACQGVVPGEELTDEDTQYIQELGILDPEEEILEFSSQSNREQSGNFYTDKRVASYWIDKTGNQTSVRSAYYDQIDSIYFIDKDTANVYNSYLIIFPRGSSPFNVYADGEQENTRGFYDEVLIRWEKANVRTRSSK